MGNYRGRIDIIADILRVAEAQAKKTQIMYRANLSYAIMQKYLAELTAASLVAYTDDTQSYALTEKGREYLVLYKEYSRANKHVEKGLTTAQNKKRVLDRLCVSHRWKSRAANQVTPNPFKNRVKEDECLS